MIRPVSVIVRRSLLTATVIAAVAGSLVPHVGPPVTLHIDKIVHSTGYAVLTMLMVWGGPRRLGLLGAALTALVLGGSLEIAQTQVPGRDGSFGDFAANAAGVGIAMVVSMWTRRRATPSGMHQSP